MATRVVSGVLAIAGAIAVVVGGYMPYAQQGKFEFRIFETKGPHALLFFAVEPAAVAVAAVVLGILILVRDPFRITAGVLLGTGVQAALYYLGFIGYYAQTNFGTDVKPAPGSGCSAGR